MRRDGILFGGSGCENQNLVFGLGTLNAHLTRANRDIWGPLQCHNPSKIASCKHHLPYRAFAKFLSPRETSLFIKSRHSSLRQLERIKKTFKIIKGPLNFQLNMVRLPLWQHFVTFVCVLSWINKFFILNN